MKHDKELSDLVSLLKVFDIDFVNDAELAKLDGLDADNDSDVRKATNEILKSQFLTNSPASRNLMLDSLKLHLADETEDFSALFDRIALAFGGQPSDRRRFMTIVLDTLAGQPSE